MSLAAVLTGKIYQMDSNQTDNKSDAAYSCISELGELGLVQFRDLNADVSAFQRKFVPELRRCDEMERKLRYLDEELQKAEIPVIDNNESPEAPLPKETLPLENDLEQLEKQMREVSQNQEQLNKNFLELTELKHVLRKTQVEISCFCFICSIFNSEFFRRSSRLRCSATWCRRSRDWRRRKNTVTEQARSFQIQKNISYCIFHVSRGFDLLPAFKNSFL